MEPLGGAALLKEVHQSGHSLPICSFCFLCAVESRSLSLQLWLPVAIMAPSSGTVSQTQHSCVSRRWPWHFIHNGKVPHRPQLI